MCGRYTLRTPLKDVVTLFDLALLEPADEVLGAARYNIAPTQQVAAVRWNAERRGRELAWLHWGLIPPWADDPAIGNGLINARAETVASKPAFRDAMRTRRCLVPADGFYEWKRENRAKQPYYIRLRDGQPFAFAGLWQRWQRGELTIESCTVITTEANELLAPLHNRMPVILDRAQFELWLDPAIDDPAVLTPLLQSYPAERMLTYPVNRVVNDARTDVPQCIEPPARSQTQGSLFD